MLAGTFALFAAVAVVCFFGMMKRNLIVSIVIVCVVFAGGFILLGSSLVHRSECKRWAQTGNYQVVEGPVENFDREEHHGNKGGNYTIETFSVQGVNFRCKSGNDAFNGGYRGTNGPIGPGVPVKIAYREGQILKLWVASGG